MQSSLRFFKKTDGLKQLKLLAAVLLPLLFLSACSSNNIEENASLGTYFTQHGVQGSFALLDNGRGSFTMYHLKRYKDSAYQPAATFNIVNALIGLQIGTIANERMIIPWDGQTRKYANGDSAAAWNKTLRFDEAFQAAATPYFQEIARRTGKEKMQYWLDSLQYGNHRIGSSIDSFWLNNTLTITADEQLGLVKRLYFGQLPFDKTWQILIKKLMLKGSNANYQLSYIDGEGIMPNQKSIGWVLGWVEENKHPYFFVLNIEGSSNTPLQNTGPQIVDDILTQLGFFKGKK
ncbi:MAG: class D beta-lactamase [Hydrotalea flava]|uniref:penicillin-binding transpeptidase domain-containing protein n=1 Tax=Hydrotalea sp. AMD TaxID=2501297 RepID=UPI0009BE0CF3|nr:penicillin-binding transpeptidase domain-containing protein [Hydrotalea sp. AMD]MBY0349114.1 class D beta-lactamase [Hydrotalea flava]RWZ88160.1 MAG: class D beta-lactamase [Hydrotalea sp. AMD]GHT50685.1 beta-lactamase [Spirochaetia bacterium]